MTDTPVTDAEQAAHRARYAFHDRIWARVDDLHGNLFWEDAQLIGDDLAKDYVAATEVERRVETARVEAFDLIRERLMQTSRTAAAAQRAHDLSEGITAIGTTTANEAEWHQMSNWALSVLGLLRAELETAPAPAKELSDQDDPNDGYEDGLWVAALPRCDIHNAGKPCPTGAGYTTGGL